MGKPLTYTIRTSDEVQGVLARIASAIGRGIQRAPVEVSLKHQESKRGSLSNAKFHAMIADLNKQAVITMPGKRVALSKYDAETCKALLVIWFAKERELNGEPLRKPPRTEIDPMTGERISIRPSTTQWGVKDTSDFIEFLYSLGAASGVNWSEPALKEYQSYKEARAA